MTSLHSRSRRFAPALACALWLTHSAASPAASTAPASPGITLDSLLREMIQRDAFARWPAVPYTCRQASSYDRRSVAPDQPGWFANQDWSQFIRVETREGRQERVLLDADGPGCLVRFWTGAPSPEGALTQRIRIYLDHAPQPVIDETVDRLCGGQGNIPPPLSAIRSIGRNLYVPLPYARHCKVTYDGDQNCWYQINYRTYPNGTPVASFSWDDFEHARPLLDQVSRLLVTPQNSVAGGHTSAPLEAVLQPGSSARRTFRGPAVIRSLALQLQADDLPQALRSTVLSIRFDNEETVWCPVGDFFGSGVGLNPYRDWWRDVDRSGLLTCYWPMPFRKSCTLEVHNHGVQPVRLTLGQITTDRWKWDARSLLFHATWRQQPHLATRKEDGFDWNFLSAEGQGLYVGDTLALHNGAGWWWGEGDEKIFVDGETFPSHFGTGTEDYYGYSFGDRGVFFEAPFHAQPRWEGNNKTGFVTVTRSRGLDAIPFTRSLHFDMEVWHWSATTVSYAATTYWYARPGASTPRKPQPEEAARPLSDLDTRLRDVLDGETAIILERTGGATEIQTGDARWNGSQQLWWRDAQPGDTLTLALPVPRAGPYRILLHTTLARDYGVMAVALDGDALGSPIDFFHDAVICRQIDLGTRVLRAGDHRLSFTVTGANPAAAPRHMLGLDYVKLVPQ